MDVNDINQRLSRLYTAVDSLTDNDVESNVIITPIAIGKDTSLDIRFDKLTKEELQNMVSQVLGLIAGLKDHLRNKMREMGKDELEVERLIDGSRSLSLVMDLHNSEKHGYPLRKHRRTDDDPKISVIMQA